MNKSQNDEMMLEIYKTYLQMADKISDRRQNANSFYLTLNTVILGFTSYFTYNGGMVKSIPFYIIISIAGMIICFQWYRMIRSYKDINSGKFKIIHEIEKKLPYAAFDNEWEILGRGKDKKKYLPFTKIEMRIPWIFFFLHLFVFIVQIRQ